ncbi:MAG: hypothetical protein ACLULM_10210, partial [Acutalibacter sp.]
MEDELLQRSIGRFSPILLWNRGTCGILFSNHTEGGKLTMTREEAERELCRLLEEAEADIQAGR